MSEFFRVWGLILVVLIIILLFSFFLSKKFKGSVWVKYIPTFAIWILSIILFVYGYFFAESMQDLGFLIMAMITGVGTFIAFIVTALIDVYRSKKKRKRNVRG